MLIVEAIPDTERGRADNDGEEDGMREVYTHARLQSEINRLPLNEADWQAMINRARLRGVREDRPLEEERTRAPHSKDKLWEIGCQVRDLLFLARM